MNKVELLNHINGYLDTAVDKIKGVTPDSTLYLKEDSPKGFIFNAGEPMAFWLTAETTQDEVILKNGNESFINPVTGMWWTKSGSVWNSVKYDGSQSVIKKSSLVLSKNTGLLYLFTDKLTWIKIDTTGETQ